MSQDKEEMPIMRREITRIITPGTFNDENKEEQK